jgi:hypothetical protein
MDVFDIDELLGCEQCWPEDAAAAWAGVVKLVHEVDLIVESHYSVRIRRCPACSRQFLSVFTETIDWADGKDPMYWTLVPVTPTEAEQLAGMKETITQQQLEALGRRRKSLRHDFPKDRPEAVSYWAFGIPVRPHD